MPDFRLLSAAGVAPADLHAAFTAAFADYLIGPFRLPLASWPVFLARQGVDLAASRVAVGEGGLLAFALAAPRPDVASWRLGTMGALPAARGSGAAPALLDDFIARAGAAGRSRVELECFAQNDRALRLYRSRGFAEVAELHGYRHPGARLDEAPEEAQAVPLEDAYAWIAAPAAAIGDLPLQVTPVSLRAQPIALRAWRSGDAQIVAGQAAAGEAMVFSLLDRTPDQRGTPALLASVARHWPGCSVHVPQLQREDLGGAALLRLGFERLPLHQVLMHKPL
jgi:GNAT superfamily N-acetyltransferase